MELNNRVKYQSITKTFQDERNSCFLACIESYLADLNIYTSQDEMISKLLPSNLCDNKGFVLRPNMISAGKILGLQIKNVEYHFPINDKYENNSLFIGVDYNPVAPAAAKVENGKFHMVRYSHHVNGNEFVIMDPAGWLGLRIWNKDDLNKVYKEFFYVSLIKG